MPRERLTDWAADELDFVEKLLKDEIQRQGPKDVFGYALQAIRTIRAEKGPAPEGPDALCREKEAEGDDEEDPWRSS